MSSFEDDMKDAFEGAEFAPSDKVWTGIESVIAPKKKKGILFMWQTYGVAAGIILATTFGFLLNDGFFNATSTLNTEQLSEDSKQEKVDGDKKDNVTPVDSLDKTNTKPDLGPQTLAATEKEEEGKKNINDLVDDKELKPSNALPLQAQNRTEANDTVIDPIKSETGDVNLNTSVAVTKSTEPVKNAESLKSNVKSTAEDLKASELLLDSKLNSALTSTTQASNIDTAATRSNTIDTTPLKSTITADLSTKSETALRIQNAVSPPRVKSVSGSLANNILNTSSGLGTANSITEANLRDPNTFNSLDATVDNAEGEALGAISAGFGASFGVSKRLSLNMSLRYSEFKFRNTSNAYSVEDGVSLPIYIPVGYNPENVFFVGVYDVENTIQSVFLQTGIGYKIATLGKFDFSLQAGIGLDYFLAYKVKGDLNFLETRKVNPRESDFLSHTNLSGVSGFSINYKMNPKFGLSADFTYRKFISSGDLASSQPSSVIGFGLSLNYILSKKEE